MSVQVIASFLSTNVIKQIARFAFQIRSPCKIVTNLLSLDCKNVHAVYHKSAFYLRWGCYNELEVCVCIQVCFHMLLFVCLVYACVSACAYASMCVT